MENRLLTSLFTFNCYYAVELSITVSGAQELGTFLILNELLIRAQHLSIFSPLFIYAKCFILVLYGSFK